MVWRTVWFFLREVSLNVRRNPMMTTASVMTVAIVTLILGAFLLLLYNLQTMKDALMAQLEIRVYLKENVSQVDVAALQARIAGLPGVTGVRFVSKEEAMKRLQESIKGEVSLQGLLSNPLPSSFTVKANAVEEIPRISATLKSFPGIEEVNSWQKFSGHLAAMNRILRGIGLGGIALLVFATLFIVMNTIRLGVFARRREIQIMQLVGATGWFIRWPFMLEGMLYGFLGSLIAVALLERGYERVVQEISRYVPLLPLISGPQTLLHLFTILLVAGITIGGVGSYLSTSRFIRY